MAQKNLVSFNVSDADMQEISNAVTVLNTKLMPHLKTLSADERHDLPKMGDKSFAFVEKALEYCEKNPELSPQFLDVNEFKDDIKAVTSLRSMYQPLLQIVESIDDTMTLSGSEAYSAALIFYNSIKGAMKSKIQKAETIYDSTAKSIFINHREY